MSCQRAQFIVMLRTTMSTRFSCRALIRSAAEMTMSSILFGSPKIALRDALGHVDVEALDLPGERVARGQQQRVGGDADAQLLVGLFRIVGDRVVRRIAGEGRQRVVGLRWRCRRSAGVVVAVPDDDGAEEWRIGVAVGIWVSAYTPLVQAPSSAAISTAATAAAGAQAGGHRYSSIRWPMPRSMRTAAPAQRTSSSQPRMVTHVTGPNSDLEVSSPKACQALVRIGGEGGERGVGRAGPGLQRQLHGTVPVAAVVGLPDGFVLGLVGVPLALQSALGVCCRGPPRRTGGCPTASARPSRRPARTLGR